MIKDFAKTKGDLKITLWDSEGTIKLQKEEKNLTVALGLNWIVSRMESDTPGVMTSMKLGSGTTAPTSLDTDVESVLGTAVAFSQAPDVVDNTIKYYCTFGAGVSVGAVTEAGIFNAADLMLCRTTFGVVTKEADDIMGIEWTIQIDAA